MLRSPLKKCLLSCWIVSLLMLFGSIFADSINDGRLLLNGVVTNEEIFGGDGLIGLSIKENYFIYSDVLGDYATDDTFLISPGLGMRTVLNNQIIGAYFFSDYEGTNLQKDFWDVGPGVEWISPKWDAHFNCYFPTTLSKQSGAIEFASQYGIDDWVTFEGHNQYDRKVKPLSVIGNGLDAELGYSFPSIKNLRSRIYVGTYYSWPNHGAENISGMTGGIEVPWTHYFEMSVANSYDTLKQYTAALRFSFIFGGHSTLLSRDVRDRLLDPVERHVGIIATGAGTYAQKGYKTISGSELEYNNIYFVRPSISSLSRNNISFATYENPAELSQKTLDDIEKHQPDGARIYVVGGRTYHVDNGTLVVHQGESLYGRSVDGTKVAIGDERPIFDETLQLEGNNTIDHLHIENDHPNQLLGDTYGIYTTGSTAVDVSATIINVSTSTGNAYGIYDGGTATVNVENGSVINVTASGSTGTSYSAYGIYDSGSAVSIKQQTGSVINVTDSGPNGTAYGIFSQNTSGAVILADASINANYTNNASTECTSGSVTAGCLFGAYGIASYAPVAVTDSSITANSQATSVWSTSFGIAPINAPVFADSASLAPSSIPTATVTRSTINAIGAGGQNGSGYGPNAIFMMGTTTVSNSTLYAESTITTLDASEATAIRTNYGSITVSDSQLTAISSSTGDQGAYVISADPSSTTFPSGLPGVSVARSTLTATDYGLATATGIHSLGALTLANSILYGTNTTASGNGVSLINSAGSTITNSVLYGVGNSSSGSVGGVGGGGTVTVSGTAVQLTGHNASTGTFTSSSHNVCMVNGSVVAC